MRAPAWLAPAQKRKRRWFPLLLMCAASSWPATAAVAATSPPPLPVVVSPCAAPTSTAPCRVDPTTIQVDLPNSTSIQAVQLSWVADPRRPANAPSPGQAQIMLSLASGSPNCAPEPSGFTAFCWAWPSSLDYSTGGTAWLLNGTYRLTPCTNASGSCNYSADYSSALAEVAVAPSAPTGVSSRQSNGAVTVTWNPGPEPDLVGYTLSRNNQPIYTCSLDGAGPGAGTPCAKPLSFPDQPGSGTWNYAVSSLRFGADASEAHVVSSAPSPTSVSVPAPGSATGGGVPGHPSGAASYGGAAAPPLPPIGSLRPAALNGSFGVAGTAVPSLASAEDSGGAATGSAGALPYNDNPALGSPLASGTEQIRHQKPLHNVSAAAELAVAMLALALAVHVWYLRGELRAATARVAARRSASGTTPTTA